MKKKRFDIYQHKTIGYRAISPDYSWFAFFFPVVWAAMERMWLQLIAAVIFFCFPFTFESAGEGITFYVIAMGLYGGYAPVWSKKRLQKRGFELVATIKARNPQEAITDAYLSMEVAHGNTTK